MVKNCIIVLLVLIIALMLTLGCGAAGNVSDQTIVIGQNGIYDLNSAVNAIGKNAGNVMIYMSGNQYLYQQVELPADRAGLKSVTLASYNGSPVSVAMSGSVICTNGVPFTVESGVTMSNGFIVGGKCNAQYGTVSTDESVLVINGAADYVIGGGLAMGAGSVSSVKNTNILVNGSANVVHGGGYAYNGGVADVSGTAYLFLTRSSNIKTAAYGGGYAGGSGSYAPVAATHVVGLGSAAKLSKSNGMAENGGSAKVGAYNIELVNPQIPNTTGNTGYPQYNGGQTNPWNNGQNTPWNNGSGQNNSWNNGQNSPWNSGSGQNNPYTKPASTVMYIGPGQQAQNFTDAVNLLPANAGNVEFRIIGNFNQNADVVIPQNRGILSLTVTGNGNRMTVTWPEDVGFFANGIPTTIANTVKFSSGTIYGGANVGMGQQSTLQTTYLDIAGSVNKVVAGSKAKGAASSARVVSSTLIFRGKASGWIHNGGAALYGGYSSIDGTANLTVMQGATCEQSISGGGYAFGSGSQSDVKDAYMDISGSVIYAVYLGGYADQSSSASVRGQSYLNLQPAGNVAQSVWYGGRAYKDSSVYVDTAMAQVSGRVGATVHKEGRGSDGGTSSIRVIR